MCMIQLSTKGVYKMFFVKKIKKFSTFNAICLFKTLTFITLLESIT